jgi:hypothetical protein
LPVSCAFGAAKIDLLLGPSLPSRMQWGRTSGSTNWAPLCRATYVWSADTFLLKHLFVRAQLLVQANHNWVKIRVETARHLSGWGKKLKWFKFSDRLKRGYKEQFCLAIRDGN